MPGLLRGVARTAVVAGTASSVAGRVSRRQSSRWARQDAQRNEEEARYQQPPPAAAPARDTVTQLKELAELKAQGILTDAEFQAQKAKILAA